MASPSPAAQQQRFQQRILSTLARRTELAEREDGRPLTNVCDWLHDTVVTNRKEKRKALGEAKRFGCYEEKIPDKERQTQTTWVHSTSCPKYDWKKGFDKKVAEQTAALDEGTVCHSAEVAAGSHGQENSHGQEIATQTEVSP